MKILLSLLLSLMILQAAAQVTNYSETGKSQKARTENIQVTVSEQAAKKEVAPILLAGLSKGVDVTVGAVGAHLSARAEKFTASYSGALNGKGILRNNTDLMLKTLKIVRRTKEDKAYTDQSVIELDFVQNGKDPMFKLKLSSLKLTTAKAKIAKWGAKKQFLDINVDIKIDASWYEFEEPKAPAPKRPDGTLKPLKAKIETTTLGQSSITVSGVKVGEALDLSNDVFETNWFKMVPPDFTERSQEKERRGWYTITVTVKEANPRGVSAKKMAEFFKDNKEGITGFFQSFMPAKEDEEEEEK